MQITKDISSKSHKIVENKHLLLCRKQMLVENMPELVETSTRLRPHYFLAISRNLTKSMSI